MNVKAGHFLEESEFTQFDAPFFNISPNEAKVRLGSSVELEWPLKKNRQRIQDPGCTWKEPTKLLKTVILSKSKMERRVNNNEIAGITLSDVVGSNTAVFVGAFSADYGDLMARDPGIFPAYKATGLAASLLSNRISHWFDLRGPSVTLDTACSSSLSALHKACECLRKGDSKTAIVSGANLMLDPNIMLSLSTLK